MSEKAEFKSNNESNKSSVSKSIKNPPIPKHAKITVVGTNNSILKTLSSKISNNSITSPPNTRQPKNQINPINQSPTSPTLNKVVSIGDIKKLSPPNTKNPAEEITLNSIAIHTYKEMRNPSEEKTFQEFCENDNKIKELCTNYNNLKTKGDVTTNSLIKLRSVLVNWLKEDNTDNNQNGQYELYTTEKKIKYLMHNIENLKHKQINLERELIILNKRKPELIELLGDEYENYDYEELVEDVQRFEESNEIKFGKSSKMKEKLEKMKEMLIFVKEFKTLKNQLLHKQAEKEEAENICKNTNITITHLINYYKNIKNKI